MLWSLHMAGSAVQYSTMQAGAVLCCAEQCSAVQSNAVQCCWLLMDLAVGYYSSATCPGHCPDQEVQSWQCSAGQCSAGYSRFTNARIVDCQSPLK